MDHKSFGDGVATVPSNIFVVLMHVFHHTLSVVEIQFVSLLANSGGRSYILSIVYDLQRTVLKKLPCLLSFYCGLSRY